MKANISDILSSGNNETRENSVLLEGRTVALSVSYNRLWKLLIDKGMTKTELRIAAKISTNALAKMGKNECVSMDTLGKITAVLHCGVDDIVEIYVDEGDKNGQQA